MTVTTIVDATTMGSAHQLGSGFAKWVSFFLTQRTGSAGRGRFGDSNVSSTRGVAIPTGKGWSLPPLENNNEGYSLSEIYVYLTGGTGTVELQVSYGQ
jgi:hypothetical protein